MRFIALKKEQNNYSKRSVFSSYGLLHLFFASNLIVFVDRGRKIIPCSRAAEYPSYATARWYTTVDCANKLHQKIKKKKI